MLTIPTNFNNDIQGKDTNLFPFVAIGNYPDDYTNYAPLIAISTNVATIGGDYFKPLLLNVPGIKESIDVEKRNYKISNVTLNISNAPYEGVRFSELVQDKSLINMEVRIFWASPSISGYSLYDYNPDWITDGSAFLAYFGTIRRYTHDDEKVQIQLEDRSQSKLHKDLPMEYLGTGNEVPDKYKNKPIPMVYGEVDRSPCVLEYVSDIDEFTGDIVGDTKIIFGLEGGGYEPLQLLLFEHDNYIEIGETVDPYNYGDSFPRVTLEGDDSHLSVQAKFFGYSGGLVQYIIDENSFRIEAVPDAPQIFSQLIGIAKSTFGTGKQNAFIPDKAINMTLVRGVLPKKIADFYRELHGAAHDNEFFVYRGSSLKEDNSNYVYGTILNESGDEYDGMDGSAQWGGGSMLTNMGSQVDGELDDIGNIFNNNQGDDSSTEFMIIGYKLDFSTNPALQFNDSMVVWNPLQIDLNSGDTEIYATSGDGYPSMMLSILDLENNIASTGFNLDHYSKQNNITADSSTGYWTNSVRMQQFEDVFGFRRCHSLYILGMMLPGSSVGDGASAGMIKNSGLEISVFAIIEAYQTKDFYANVKGSVDTGSDYFTTDDNEYRYPDRQIKHILLNELAFQGNVEHRVWNFDIYAPWFTDFTINKKINSKKLIEGLASATPLLPRFDNMGNFKLDAIESKFTSEDTGEVIKAVDVIDYSFSKTKIEDVYTRIEFKYNWDYAREEFSKTANLLINESWVIANLGIAGYDYSFYGLAEGTAESNLVDSTSIPAIEDDEVNADSTLIVEDDRGKYIRDDNTAGYFVKWLLYWHCNQHLKMKVKLPLKYMSLEIGDYVYFDELINDVKAYGIDYSKTYIAGEVQFLNGQQIFRQFLVTSTNKTLEYVEIECIQMHNLTDNLIPLYEGEITYVCNTPEAINYEGIDYGQGIHPDNNLCIFPEYACGVPDFNGQPPDNYEALADTTDAEGVTGDSTLAFNTLNSAQTYWQALQGEDIGLYNEWTWYINDINECIIPEPPEAPTVIYAHLRTSLVGGSPAFDHNYVIYPEYWDITNWEQEYATHAQADGDINFAFSFGWNSPDVGIASAKLKLNVQTWSEAFDTDFYDIALSEFTDISWNDIAPDSWDWSIQSTIMITPIVKITNDYGNEYSITLNFTMLIWSPSGDGDAEPPPLYTPRLKLPFQPLGTVSPLPVEPFPTPRPEYVPPHSYMPRPRPGFGYIPKSCQNALGDANSDGAINVLDIVNVINHILDRNYLEGCELEAADFNEDGAVNVLDIVNIVNEIL